MSDPSVVMHLFEAKCSRGTPDTLDLETRSVIRAYGKSLLGCATRSRAHRERDVRELGLDQLNQPMELILLELQVQFPPADEESPGPQMKRVAFALATDAVCVRIRRQRVHVALVDPLPSNPHAHCISGKCKGYTLHLGTRGLFIGRRELDLKLQEDQFHRLIELIQPKFPDITLPVCT